MKAFTRTNLLLLLAVIVLAAVPLVFGLGSNAPEGAEPFAGADAQAETAITETAPDYEPWFSSVFEPPSGEVESGLFALQAAIGAGVVGYYFGVARTRRLLTAPPEDDAPADDEATPVGDGGR